MKWKESYKHSLATFVVVLIGGIGITHVVQTPLGRYRVMDKKDNKIWYKSLSNPQSTHVMTFCADTTGNGLYDDLKVGDIITGEERKFNDSVVNSTETVVGGPMLYYVIRTVNGKRVRKLPGRIPTGALKQKQR